MTALEQIAKFLKENYTALKPSELKEEAKRLTDRLEKQAAGRVSEQSPDERADSFKKIEKYYEEKRLWYRIVGLPVIVHRTLSQGKTNNK